MVEFYLHYTCSHAFIFPTDVRTKDPIFSRIELTTPHYLIVICEVSSKHTLNCRT